MNFFFFFSLGFEEDTEDRISQAGLTNRTSGMNNLKILNTGDGKSTKMEVSWESWDACLGSHQLFWVLSAPAPASHAYQPRAQRQWSIARNKLSHKQVTQVLMPQDIREIILLICSSPIWSIPFRNSIWSLRSHMNKWKNILGLTLSFESTWWLFTIENNYLVCRA